MLSALTTQCPSGADSVTSQCVFHVPAAPVLRLLMVLHVAVCVVTAGLLSAAGGAGAGGLESG